MLTLALTTANFLQIVPSTQNPTKLNLSIKYLSCIILLTCGSIVINSRLQFKNFTQSVKDCYSILWVLSSFLIKASLLYQKTKIYKLQKEISKRSKLSKFANAYFSTFLLILISFFSFESYFMTRKTSKFYFNPQIYPLFIIYLHDVISAETVLSYVNELEKIVTQVETADKVALFKHLSNSHHNLIDSFENMSEIFALSRLCSVSICFLTLVFSFYFTFEGASATPWPVSGLFWISLHLTKLCYLAYATADFNQKVCFNW